MTERGSDGRGGPPVAALAATLCRELAAGASLDDLLRRHPGLTPDGLRAAFAQAADLLSGKPGEPATLPPPGGPADDATLAPPSAEDLPTLGAPAPGGRTVFDGAYLPHYELLGELGRGGMGVVYKARHLKLNRLVALKLILAGEHAGPEALARFQREAEAVAALQHPNVVTVYEVGEHNGQSFLALELVAGGSLAARLTGEPWPADEAAALVEKLARAVHEAHRQGVVHRDLKPENVLLTADNEPKVSDFGLAKRLDDPGGRTRTGEVMGTPSYMAPEQAAGRKDVGPAADVWAMGAILHRLLTGKVPFEGPTTLDVLMSVLQDEPTPPRRLNAAVPRDLETITLKCLRKDPARRYASAKSLAEDLRRFLDGEPIVARRVPWPERAWRWSRKHPFRAMLRGAAGLMLLSWAAVPLGFAKLTGLAMVTVFLVLLAAVLRARPKPLLLGSLISVFVVGPVALIGVGIAADYYLGGPAFSSNVGDLFFAVAGAALALGIAVGALYTERWRALAAGLLALAASAGAMALEGTHPGLLSAAVAAAYVGLVTRLARWRWPGDPTDTVAGCLVGWVVGFMSGAMLIGCFSAMKGFPGVGSEPDAMFVAMGVALVGLGVAGGVGGAILLAMATRPSRGVASG